MKEGDKVNKTKDAYRKELEQIYEKMRRQNLKNIESVRRLQDDHKQILTQYAIPEWYKKKMIRGIRYLTTLVENESKRNEAFKGFIECWVQERVN